MKSKIISCSCPHEFQDSRYGKGKRVHNPKRGGRAGGKSKDGDRAAGWRCTVCGDEKPGG